MLPEVESTIHIRRRGRSASLELRGGRDAVDFPSRDEEHPGATAVELTLITSIIAVAAIASMRSVTGKVTNVLNAVGPLN